MEQFGIEQLRVLTIMTSQERIETMLDAVGEITGGKGSNLFLFADEAQLAVNSPLDMEWISGKCKLLRLLD